MKTRVIASKLNYIVLFHNGVLSLSSNRNDICVTWLGFASTITDEQARLLNLRVLNSVERRSGV